MHINDESTESTLESIASNLSCDYHFFFRFVLFLIRIVEMLNHVFMSSHIVVATRQRQKQKTNKQTNQADNEKHGEKKGEEEDTVIKRETCAVQFKYCVCLCVFCYNHILI